MRIVVDLPAPLAPRKPKISPGSTLSEISSTAWNVPKRLLSSTSSTAGAIQRPTARSRPAAASRMAALASVRESDARSCATSASVSSEDGMTPAR